MLAAMLSAAWSAGSRVLAVYATDFSVSRKSDSSPVTLADQEAESAIISSLADRFPEIPAISEETRLPPYERRSQYERYWLVDPLDGTREFVKRNGEFTVNIALMVNNRPVLGVIYAPVPGVWYCGGPDSGVWSFTTVHSVREPDWPSSIAPERRLSRRDASSGAAVERPQTLVAAVSRSHESERAQAVFNRVREAGIELRTIPRGSSLKFGMVADSTADCYLRYGRTMEWDTAAGEAVVRGAGCAVLRIEDLLPLAYNKKDLSNPGFVVFSPIAGRILESALFPDRRANGQFGQRQ
jgi:3'(2'), 5'-bisphosphate nucleotidase